MVCYRDSSTQLAKMQIVTVNPAGPTYVDFGAPSATYGLTGQIGLGVAAYDEDAAVAVWETETASGWQADYYVDISGAVPALAGSLVTWNAPTGGITQTINMASVDSERAILTFNCPT